MCRIFFSFSGRHLAAKKEYAVTDTECRMRLKYSTQGCSVNEKTNEKKTETKKFIDEFLKQSHHADKNTPGLSNALDHSTHPDGFGLAWQNPSNKWQLYKSHKKYTEISDLDKTIHKIDKNDDIVIGHIRRATDGKPAIENSHPFLYQNQLFLQNGEITDFKTHRNKLIMEVDSDLLKHVKGETDTELLFYMFLTIKRRLTQTQRLTQKLFNDAAEKIIAESFRELFHIFTKQNIKISANIIYANDKYAVITRYRYYSGRNKGEDEVTDTETVAFGTEAKVSDKIASGFNQKNTHLPPSLYYDTSHGLLITSEPITPHFKLFPENTMIIVEMVTPIFTVLDIS